MDPSTYCRRHSRQVDDQISDLAEEVVCVGIPVLPTVQVRIGVNDGHALKRGGSFDGGKSNGISDQLGVVELDHWLAHDVCTGWEIDESWSDCGRVASLTASVA